MSLLTPNLDSKGRLIRAVGALALAAGAALVWPHSQPAAVGLAGASAFMAFEAARGWCALRACGVKTKF